MTAEHLWARVQQPPSDAAAVAAWLHGRADGAPALWDPALRGPVFVQHDACAAVLKAPWLERAPPRLPLVPGQEELRAVAADVLEAQALFRDDAELRGVQGALLARHEVAVEDRVRDCLDGVRVGARLDLLGELLDPLVSAVAFDAAGVDPAQRPALVPHVRVCARALDGKLRSVRELTAWMVGVVSVYSALAPRWRGLPGDEAHRATANQVALLVAAHDSTAWWLATALRHDQPRASIVGLLAECLRFDPPVTLIGRVAAADGVIAGVDVPAGTPVFAHLGAAGRDPLAWERPSEFRPDRAAGPGQAGRSLAFGRGRSACPGRSLATRVASAFLAEWRQRGFRFVSDAASLRDGSFRDDGLAAPGLTALPGRVQRRATMGVELDVSTVSC